MDELNRLAARISLGDAGAVLELRRELEGKMVHIVRRAMRANPAASGLTRQILDKAEQLAGPRHRWPSENREGLIRQVASRLCDNVVRGLRPAARIDQALLDTVRA
jgi:hypothetical protein